jgi:hypothetical protein
MCIFYFNPSANFFPQIDACENYFHIWTQGHGAIVHGALCGLKDAKCGDAQGIHLHLGPRGMPTGMTLTPLALLYWFGADSFFVIFSSFFLNPPPLSPLAALSGDSML